MKIEKRRKLLFVVRYNCRENQLYTKKEFSYDKKYFQTKITEKDEFDKKGIRR